MSYDLHLFRPWAKAASPEEVMNCLEGEPSDEAHRLTLDRSECAILHEEWSSHWGSPDGADDAPAYYNISDCSLDLHLTYDIEDRRARQMSARFQHCAFRLAQRLSMVIYDPQEDGWLEPHYKAPGPKHAAARFDEGREAIRSVNDAAHAGRRPPWWRRLFRGES